LNIFQKKKEMNGNFDAINVSNLHFNDIENELKNHIQAIETNTIGIVPPTFVLKTETNVLTPADETINKD